MLRYEQSPLRYAGWELPEVILVLDTNVLIDNLGLLWMLRNIHESTLKIASNSETALMHLFWFRDGNRDRFHSMGWFCGKSTV